MLGQKKTTGGAPPSLFRLSKIVLFTLHNCCVPRSLKYLKSYLSLKVVFLKFLAFTVYRNVKCIYFCIAGAEKAL